MVLTMSLPANILVADVSARVRDALVEFVAMDPTKQGLAQWLAGPYRRSLVVSTGNDIALTFGLTADVDVAIEQAKRNVAATRLAARSADGGRFVDRLPARVHVVPIRDAAGATGFGPVDVRGATLSARALSLLLADYLMRPEVYVGTRAA